MSTGANESRKAATGGDAHSLSIGTLSTELETCLHAAIESMANGLVIYDQFSRLVFANERYCQLYGLEVAASEADDDGNHPPNNQLCAGMHITDVIRRQGDAMNLPESEIDEYLDAALSRGSDNWRSTTRVFEDGRTIQVTRRTMRGGHYVATHEDITDRIASETRMRFMASHDSLTELPNRAQFMERLDNAMLRVRRGDQIALQMLDLDRFKHVNDTYGHSIGDQLLVEVSKRLKEAVRDTDLIARLGGDEFAIIQIPAPTHGDAERLAQRLLEALSHPFIFGNLTLMMGTSIGISIANPENCDATEVMLQSDAALYKAKNDGRSVFRFFEERLNAEIQGRARIENQMRQALVKNEFEIHYQPIVNVERSRVETCEALLRMRDNNGTLVPPNLFVPVAEESGLIVLIGEWVLRQACIDAAAWPEHISVAVNISPLQFRAGSLLETIEAALDASGLPAHRLEVEITESLLLDTSLDIISILHELRKKGVRIAMDDFGTGYSSLKYLTSFPFDKIKIDRSFVKGLPDATQQLAVLRAVASLGCSLGIKTTVEGVETIEQLDIARDERCSDVQGFYFARPTPAASLHLAITASEVLAKAAEAKLETRGSAA
ncbi:MAG: EAL domain-containing protein [Hyphomicrobiaceae bacterium]